VHSNLNQNKEAAQDLNHYLKIMGNKHGDAETVRGKIRQLGYNPEY
jgi:hypothetical protein